MAESLEDTLQALDLTGCEIEDAGWLDGLQDFELTLTDGRALLFRDCLQVSVHRPPGIVESVTVGGWWTDEPSPVDVAAPPPSPPSPPAAVADIGSSVDPSSKRLNPPKYPPTEARQGVEERRKLAEDPLGDLRPQALEGSQQERNDDQCRPHVAEQLADQRAGHSAPPWYRK